MSGDDRYTVAEFARRYKIIQARLDAICEFFGLSAETILTRDEFRQMLAEYRSRKPAEKDNNNEGRALPEDEPSNREEHPQEENVSEVKKTYQRWVKAKKVRHPVYLKMSAGYDDDTELTEAEFDRARDKYLFNKES